MKKYCIFSLIFVFFNTQAEEVDKGYLPAFHDIKSIVINKHVQDDVRVMCSNLLNMISEILQNPQKKGSLPDISEARRDIGYLLSLRTALEQATTLKRISMLLSLNKTGKQSIQNVLNLLNQLRQVTSLSQLQSILAQSYQISDISVNGESVAPVSEELLKLLSSYEQLKTDRDNAKSYGDICHIFEGNVDATKTLSELKSASENLKTLGDMTTADELIENEIINVSLKQQINTLIDNINAIKEITELEKFYKLQIINPSLIEEIKNKEVSIEKQELEIEKLQQEVKEVNLKLSKMEDIKERDSRFGRQLIAVIIRALIGFDYRSKEINSQKEKNNKSALLVSIKESLSYLGGNASKLYAITDDLERVLQILLRNKQWTNDINEIEKILYRIQNELKKFNEEAGLIKLNVEYALEIIDAYKKKSSKTPRDNVQNFTQSLVQTDLESNK